LTSIIEIYKLRRNLKNWSITDEKNSNTVGF